MSYSGHKPYAWHPWLRYTQSTYSTCRRHTSQGDPPAWLLWDKPHPQTGTLPDLEHTDAVSPLYHKELIGVYANQISEYRDKRESENRKIVKAKNCSHIVHNMLIGVYAALGGLVLLAVYRIYKKDADLLSLLSIAFSIVSSIILGIFGKSPNPRSVINKIASSVYNHLCMLFHCSEQNTIALDEKVYYLEKRIRELESETEELQAS